MKILFLFIYLLFVNLFSNAQNFSNLEEGNENDYNVTVDSDNILEDNSGTTINEQFHYLKDKPIDLNQISGEELADLFSLDYYQIQIFINYRNSVGYFIDFHELQSLPGWDLALLRKIRPYVYVSTSKSISDFLKINFINQKNLLLIRYVNSFLKTDTFKNHSLAFRYNYDSRKNISLGLIGENDAGETFAFEKNKKGFDFISGYVFYKGKEFIKSIIVGDYVINLGQGLIHWQSAGFNKGASVDCIKRQGLTLKPYHSFGEYNFHRGIALQLVKKEFTLSLFVSSKKLDAFTNFDSTNHESQTISSFDLSGLHNTVSSMQRKYNIHECIVGGTLNYQKKHSVLGLNFLHLNYSLPLKPDSKTPYSLFSFRGKRLTNFSFNYAHTINNFHFFGELASDLQNFATVNGVIFSISEKADLSFSQRTISRSYHSFYSNTFTTQSKPINESGFYFGMGLKLIRQLKLNGFIDFYKFPWLKYSINSPSIGSEAGFSLHYLPTKKSKLIFFYGYKKDISFQLESETPNNNSIWLKNCYKMDSEFSLSKSFSIKSRFAFLKLKTHSNTSETGVLSFVDIFYKPLTNPFSACLRIFNFDTDGYNSRIYAYENDIMYTYSMNSFYGKGKGIYLNSSYKFNKHIRLEAKWSMILSNENGNNSVNEWKKSQLKFQILAFF